MQNQTADPLGQVQLELRPHIHLVSSFKCENRGDPFNLSKSQIVELLKTAAFETKGNNESWCWKVLEAPKDRTALIIWQSPQQLQGRHFPSDGLIWADTEAATIEHVDGVKLETYRHHAGYVPPFEHFTLHSRTRYRLIPAVPNQGSSSCDPCLWLVLYQKAAKSKINHTSVVDLSIAAPQKQLLEQRRLILQYGLPKSKDFVWEDRAHWPELRLPPSQAAQRLHGTNHISRTQQSTFVAGHQLLDARASPHPAKRLKQAPAAPTFSLPEGEDDGGGGDYMDILTPRDISRARYKQHVEWMEELFASPYAINEINPINLGLGRAGELSILSKHVSFLDTPKELDDIVEARKITSMDFDRYVKNVEEKTTALRAEIESQHDTHLRRLARIQRGVLIQDAEKRLRTSVQFPSHYNSTSVQHRAEREPTDRAPTQRDVDAASLRQIDDIDKVVRSVEESTRMKITTTLLSDMISKGGLEEKVETPEEMLGDQTDQVPKDVTPIQATSASHEFVAGTDMSDVNSDQALAGPNHSNSAMSQHEDDYVMVDKDQREGNSPTYKTGDAEDGLQPPGDGLGGDSFLNFEGDANDDNFDSMFTDAIGNDNDLDVAEEGVMDVMESSIVDQSTEQHTPVEPMSTDHARP